MTTTSPVGRPLRPRGKLLQEDARRHHRSLLLQQLFRGGPASRADLARTTGLTRVTVSDLVGELVGDGLVEELGAPAGSRVGKPPTLVGLAADSAHIIGIDLSADGPDDRRGAQPARRGPGPPRDRASTAPRAPTRSRWCTGSPPS